MRLLQQRPLLASVIVFSLVLVTALATLGLLAQFFPAYINAREVARPHNL